MKKLNVKTKYSSAASAILTTIRFINILLIIGVLAIVFFDDLGPFEKGPTVIAGLVMILINWLSSAFLSAITGIAKASEYYMAVIESEYSINETSGDDKLEKFIEVKKANGAKNSLPYNVGDFVYCEPKGMTAVVLSIKGNNISCGAENENGEMVEIGTFKAEDISPLN